MDAVSESSVWESHETKCQLAEAKSRQRRNCENVEQYDWVESEIDLTLLEAVAVLAELTADAAQGAASNDTIRKHRIARAQQARQCVQRLLEERFCWSEDIRRALLASSEALKHAGSRFGEASAQGTASANSTEESQNDAPKRALAGKLAGIFGIGRSED